MPKYEVGVRQEIDGIVRVEASNEKEAQEMAENYIFDGGIWEEQNSSIEIGEVNEEY